MPIDFPNSPTVGQVYTYQGKSWIWNGSAWDVPRALNELGAIRSFANAADRTAAIPSPTEGIVTYLNDTNAVEVFNNGWNILNPSSDNFIINGGFDIWQRGLSVTHSASTDNAGTAYTADRFRAANVRDGVAWRNITVSRSTNIPASAGVKYSARVTTGANDVNRLQFEQAGEDWDLLAGMPVTFSFYIRRLGTAHSSTTLRINAAGQTSQIWGSFNNLSTSEFTRITRTFTATSAFNSVGIQIITDAVSTPILTTAGDLFEITGVQVEAGTVATPFRRNAPSIQAELAACQRYFFRGGPGATGQAVLLGQASMIISHPVPMRAAPSVTHNGNYGVLEVNVAGRTATGLAGFGAGTLATTLDITVGAGGMTPPNRVIIAGNATANLDFSAEL
jgi:hypothetical protein